MKKYLFLSIGILLLVTGCFKKDSLEDVTVYATNYPIEYITNRLYGDNGNVLTIYPNNINIEKYSLTDKQLTDYSKGRIFIYNGLSREKDYAIKMLNKNQKLLIIDAAMDMEYSKKSEEIWADPSNFLMMAQNIKDGFKEYITNAYLKKEIDENYDKLKIEISEIDAELKLIAENAVNKTIVTNNDLLLFLQKYNFEVISLEENEDLTDKKIADVKRLISNGKVNYIFIKDNEELNGTSKLLVDQYQINTISYKTGSNLSDAERAEKIDFIEIMKNNIEELKKEVYQ